MHKKQLGLKENWRQFSLLVLVNAFVGGMVGLERSILLQLAEEEFHLAAKTATLFYCGIWYHQSTHELFCRDARQ